MSQVRGRVTARPRIRPRTSQKGIRMRFRGNFSRLRPGTIRYVALGVVLGLVVVGAGDTVTAPGAIALGARTADEHSLLPNVAPNLPAMLPAMLPGLPAAGGH